MKVSKSSLKFYASPGAVINQFLYLHGTDRVKNIVERIKKFSEEEIKEYLQEVKNEFAGRHRNIEEVFSEHFTKVSNQFAGNISSFSETRKLLLGSFFTKEYSIQAAALFNPSIVPHFDQQNLNAGEQRFIMSLRATGEGHISSVVFKTGKVDNLLNITFDDGPQYFTRLQKNEEAQYSKDFVKERIRFFLDFEISILEDLPESFTAKEAISSVRIMLSEDRCSSMSIHHLEEIFDNNYELQTSSQIPINEKVIFPNAKAESMGMEDVRFVKFEDGGNSCYYGTYTAYNGHNIKTQLIETKDFNVFKIRTLFGEAISDKGMALFPEKVNGKYVMTARQGGEKMSIMFSDDLYFWNDFQILMAPEYSWEIVQIGNCGSPLKTGAGWLLLTHGVGSMRTYVISAILLDLKDPSKIIGRLNKPFLKADGYEREGYVPNVVYTCGLLRHADTLIIPYAVSDSATGFTSIDLKDILDELNSLKN
ncbi:MAG TPA: glycoside hydrolase family 130 protein [Chitinophagaceae bacterium]|nr:glycoside hydrolase family 130 protein [Chitinophagaceae bacterium]